MNQSTVNQSPALYLQNTNWLFQESKGTKWTAEENKQFENALALYDKDTPDRWQKVAAMIPGKTVGDVLKQYKELEEDVSDIEAGLIPIPGYGSNSFTLEWVNSNNQEFDGFSQFYSPGCKRGASSRPCEQERKKGIPWTEEEHRQFLMGLKKYGKGDWRNISRNFVTTRTPTQVASHAQKYFIRQHTGGKDKRRSSIHDITTLNIPDTKPKSPEHPQKETQPPRDLEKQKHDWKSPNQGMHMVFNPTNGNNMFMSPFCGMSLSTSYGPVFQEQNLLGVAIHGSQWGTNYNAIFQMQSLQHQ